MADTVNAVQVQKFLEGMQYPANKSQLLEHAKSHGADENVIATLQRLPEQSFETSADVSLAIGQIE